MLARKMDHFRPSIFVELGAAMRHARAEGVDILDVSVGTPDLPPARHIMDAMAEGARDPAQYKYALTDTPALTDAILDWYARRHGVMLERREALGLIGSQDGLAHLPLMALNPGDVALVPDPGYPMFLTGPRLAQAECVSTPLAEENGYLPDLDAIPPDVAHRTKLLTISYPANPLGRLAPVEFFERCVRFARKTGCVVLHDNAYGELTLDGGESHSFLQAKGAKEVGVELCSLSKTYNLTGARISYMAGSAELCEGLCRLKSNIDYGIFLPVQRAAVAALTGSQDCVQEARRAYRARRDALLDALAQVGWQVTPPQAGMFVWTKLPSGDSRTFCLDLLAKTGVTIVPGVSFGPGGEGYARIGLVLPPDKMREAARRIGAYLRG